MSTMNALKNAPKTADDLVGSFRTFGSEGPLYKVVRKTDDVKVHVCVIESGEEFDYRIDRALADPEAK